MVIVNIVTVSNKYPWQEDLWSSDASGAAGGVAAKGLWAITIILQHSRRALVPPDLCPVDSLDRVST